MSPSSADDSRAAPARRRRSRITLVLIGVFSVLIVGEILTRLLPLEAFEPDQLMLDFSATRYEAHPYLAYAPRKSWSLDDGQHSTSHNALGFRGPEMRREKRPGALRIVCVGGSSTYGHGPSSNEHTWPMQLDAMLDEAYPDVLIEVINAGASGYSTYESLINLAIRIIDLEPDMVAVYHSINDVRLWRWPGIQPDNSHWRAVWPVYVQSSVTQALENSRLFLVLRAAFTDYTSKAELGSWVTRNYGEVEPLWDAPQMEGLTFFRRNLEHMIALCRQNDVEIVLGQQAWFREDLERPVDIKGMAFAAQVIDAVGEEVGVAVVDVDAALPQERELFTNDVHVTDEGARRIARAWADFIEVDGFVERRLNRFREER
jgi:lysophospholipase L1-like esterase